MPILGLTLKNKEKSDFVSRKRSIVTFGVSLYRL